MKTRRNFLKAGILGLLAYLPASLYAHAFSRKGYKVKRVVRFPHPMSENHFETISEKYCDHISIQAFCRQLKREGKLIAVDQVFSDQQVTYNLTFADRDSYLNYVNVISSKWFDVEKFTEMGFLGELVEPS